MKQNFISRELFIGLFLVSGLAFPKTGNAEQVLEEGAPLPTSAVRAVVPLVLRTNELTLRTQVLKTALKDLLQGLRGVKLIENDLEFRIIFESDILFDFDKANIRADAEHTLAIVAGALEQFRGKRIRIIGFTDSKGTDEYNLRLSLRRASSAKLWLSAQPNLASFSFVAEGKGEAEPIAANTLANGADNPDGRQKNRRVEIRIPK